MASEVEPENEALIFRSPRGTPLRHSNFYRRVWRSALEAAGLPDEVRVHDLRHTAASLLIAQGAGPKAICEQLGHSSGQVSLDRYGHLFPSEFENLADRLDTAYRDASAVPVAETRGQIARMTRSEA